MYNDDTQNAQLGTPRTQSLIVWADNTGQYSEQFFASTQKMRIWNLNCIHFRAPVFVHLTNRVEKFIVESSATAPRCTSPLRKLVLRDWPTPRNTHHLAAKVPSGMRKQSRHPLE